ncbi:MAG TPA: FtsX-like permease family protein [Galbitalea sp.]|jgi:putative ABC transport system permease protein|nr:FtsX-like permease family protein [Galbitalea sp.]
MRAGLTGGNLPLRSARGIRGGLVALGIVIFVLCTALVAWPRATTNILTSDLQYRMTAASASTRDLQSVIDASSGYVIGYGQPPAPNLKPVWDSMPSTLTRVRAEMPASVRAITAPGRYVGQDGGSGGQGISASGPPDPPAGSSYLMTLEANPLLQSDAVLVAGTWPAPSKDFPGTGILQVAIAAKAAKLLHWSIGETQTLSGANHEPETVKLVGTLKPRDESSDYWQLDGARAQAGATPSTDGDHTTYDAVIWMNAKSWTTAGAAFAGISVFPWFSVSGGALTGDNVSPTVGDLQRFLSVPRSVGSLGSQSQLRFTTNLTSVTDDFLARASPAAAVLSVVGTGPLGTGCAVVLLGVILLVDRRRVVISLIRARGASERRLRGTVAAEIALSTVPAAVAGGALAAWLTPGPVNALLVLTVVGCALLPMVAAAVRVGARRDTVAPRAAQNPVRWVTEIVVLLLAALSVVLLLQRGLDPDSTAVGVDPLLTLTPILVVSVGCLALLRGYPFALRWIGTLLRRRRGVVGYVGWATAARSPARFLSVFAVVAGVSVTIFSFTILATEREGIGDAVLQRVGADVSISAQPLQTDAPGRLARLPGVEHVVSIDSAGGVSITRVSDAVALFTVNAKQLADVQATLPPSLRQFAGLGAISNGRTTAIAGGFQQKPPSTASIQGNSNIAANLQPLVGPSPTFVSDPPWILLDRAAIPRGAGFTEQPLAVLLQLGPGADTATTRASIRRIVGSNATIVDGAALVRASRTAPVVSGFEGITALALGLSALMCGIALVLTLLINTPARIRLLARLRALGFAGRQAGGLVGWELGPLVVLGGVAGLAVGLVLPPLLLGAVDLAGFTGSVTDPAIVLDPIAIAATVGGFLVAAALATLVAIGTARRARAAAILRTSGED